MTLRDGECGRCHGAGGLYTDGVDTRFDCLCLPCARTLARQDDLDAEVSEVVA
ncbi:hypothetical protein [Haloglomus irregulare]|jgi:hypothetical protein|uniref:hypothetical protein n=1 Tax=Haloglomus irregulare TaxID=2234134 RepID=UPI00163D75A4|nr:hypothetical protein [Haloglomus irregulare]